MNASNQNHFASARPRPGNRGGLAALITALVLGSAGLAGAAGNPGILPVQSQPYGRSYGEWSVAWWQWALSIPAASSPLFDTTGEFAGVGQNGPVWFLAGTLGNSAERTFSMPAGKAMLVPVHNWIFGAIAGDCDPSNPGVPCDVPTLRAAAAAAAGSVQTLEATVDGRTVLNVRDYRVVCPDSFPVMLPAGNFIGLPAGIYGPQVADGYWLMLRPLEPGTHTITVRAVNPPFGIDYTVTSHITVQDNGADSQQASE